MDKYDVSIVIACFNEAPHLKQSVVEIQEVMNNTIFSYELIFVDDCSTDETRQVIQEITFQNSEGMKVLFHDVNEGRGGAVTDGMRLAEGRYVGFLDIDLEVHARYIPSMILALKNGYDVATAFRIYRLGASSIIRHILSHGYRIISRALLGERLKDTETGFKFFNRKKIIPILSQLQDMGWFCDTEIMVRSLKAGLKIIEIPCLFIRRSDKKSTVNIKKDALDYFVSLFRFRKEIE